MYDFYSIELTFRSMKHKGFFRSITVEIKQAKQHDWSFFSLVTIYIKNEKIGLSRWEITCVCDDA